MKFTITLDVHPATKDVHIIQINNRHIDYCQWEYHITDREALVYYEGLNRWTKWENDKIFVKTTKRFTREVSKGLLLRCMMDPAKYLIKMIRKQEL